jgi:oligopeptide transport system substrate-binding protein
MGSSFWAKAACGIAFCLGLGGTATADDKIVARYNQAEPETLDYQLTTGLPDLQVEQDLFEGLTRFSREQTVLPGIALRWDVSSDGLTYTFHLRSGATWSNGDPVTAADFLYAFRRLVDPKTAASDIDPVRSIVNAEAINAGKITDLTALGVAAPDPSTLVITLAHPDLVLPEKLARTYPLPRAAIERLGNEWTRPGKMVSNGPFTLRSWVPHDQIVLDKSQTYYGRDEIKIDTVRHVVVDNDNTGFLSWQTGELDVARPPTKELATLKARFGDRLHRGAVRGVQYVMVNMGQAPLGTDQRLREALNLAIDREALVTKILPRGEEAAYSYVPPVIANYTPQRLSFEAMKMPDRIARAKQLLADAGYGPDHPLALEITYATNDDTRTVMSAIRQMWTGIGVQVTLTNEEFQVYLETLNHKTHQVGAIGLFIAFDDADQFLRIYRSDSGDLNDAGFANPDYDTLIKRAETAVDLSARRAALEQAERLLMAEMPVFPLRYEVSNTLVNDRIVGWVDNDLTPESRFLSIKG